MKYPKSMKILGQEVGVSIVDKPIYQKHTCPVCMFNGAHLEFPVPFGSEDKACPACGCENTIPVKNSYVLGKFSVRENAITNWHDESYKDVCETSFVHETIEAINSICDLKMPHQTITTLAAAIKQAFTTGGVNFAEDGNYAEAA